MNWMRTYLVCRLQLMLILPLLVMCVHAHSTPSKQIDFLSLSKKKNKVIVSWSVCTKQENVYYEIERAGKDKKFRTAGILFPDETKNVNGKFVFNDQLKHNSYKILYYRIKQVKADGSFSYSSIKKLNAGIIHTEDPYVAPRKYAVHNNPYNQEKCITIYNAKDLMAGILSINFISISNSSYNTF